MKMEPKVKATNSGLNSTNQPMILKKSHNPK